MHDLAPIRAALAGQRYETARRLCRERLAQQATPDTELLLLLHEAKRRLGDLAGAIGMLHLIEDSDHDQRLAAALLLAEDYQLLASYDHYRNSAEKQEGLSGDEFVDKYQRLAAAALQEAEKLADTPERRQRFAKATQPARRRQPAPPKTLQDNAPSGQLAGRLRFADDSPVANAQVTLGYPLAITAPDPRNHLEAGLDGSILPTVHAPQQTATVATDPQGNYRFPAVPALRHDFLAVQLDPACHDQALFFVAHGVEVQAGATTVLDAEVRPWTSAPACPVASPFADTRLIDGHSGRKLAEWSWKNPFHFSFPEQAVHLPLVDAARAAGGQLRLFASHAPEQPLPTQIVDDQLLFFANLPACTDRLLALYAVDADTPPPPPVPGPETRRLSCTEADDGDLVLDTGRAQFRLPGRHRPAATPPLLAVRGEDGAWRGSSRFVLPPGTTIVDRQVATLAAGPLEWTVDFTYAFAGGELWRLRLTAHAGEAYLLVHETSFPLPGAAFEFSLREFAGGRGFLHWTPEKGSVHWTNLEACDRECARLQESVAWWIPTQGFGYAMTAGNLASQDYIGVFTRRRGEWIDREFERLAQGPGDNHRELDWPYPEMVGSTISMITANTTADGDAAFRFAFFDGERHWGMLVSTLEHNDGPHKEISRIQHQTSSPRLEQFVHWRLDQPDHHQRPTLLTRNERLRLLRRRRAEPLFQVAWENICQGDRRTPARGLRALVDADPAIAWRLSREMLAEAPLRSRMTLFGRDYSDVYSPVGGRDITPFAEQYDLIACTGVFTADEERQLRSSLMLWGHMFMEKDFMNWGYNSRNANFEADRVDIVGAIGLAFRGNPDADQFIQHAIDLMERSLEVYCTPGSGKWYENPACYYLRASTCRLNLVFHLHAHGLIDVAALPRLRDFIRWGILLLTPPCPTSQATLRDGAGDLPWEAVPRGRLIPPIGDHAQLGQRVSEFYPLMARLYHPIDPEFADLLVWAYQQSGSQGGQFSRYPLFFAAMEPEDLAPAGHHQLASRRLEGFGAVLRGQFGQPNEFYLLLKQGPGGYRYHRTEGSIILFANGRPLVYDGGEAGETWRHSTLSFHHSHMPLAPGHVERFHTLPSLEFVQGVHPKALAPGEPVFLSDQCDHCLVQTAFERFHEANPADLRSVLWVKDEYLVLHDDLHLPPNLQTHWHLQVVADRHRGNLTDGYRFAGRFGTDLQVVVRGLAGASETVAQVPILDYHVPAAECFAMRHLQLSTRSPRRIAALLRPLPGQQGELSCEETADGILHVRGDGIDDTLVLARQPVAIDRPGLRCQARYAAILRRPAGTTLVLLDGDYLEVDSHAIAGNGHPQELRLPH